MTLGLFARQTGHAPAVLDGIQGDFDLVTDIDLEFTVGIDELLLGDDAFGLESGVDDNAFVVDLDHGADDDGPRLADWCWLDSLQRVRQSFQS